MPTYEYHCDSCDRNFDVVQSFHDDPLEACPTCSSPVRKVYGNVGIVFKGSGFYKTDSRTSDATKGGEAASTPDTGSDGAASDGEGSGRGEGKGAGSGDTATPASTPTKKEPATTSPATPSSGNGKSSSGSKAPAKT